MAHKNKRRGNRWERDGIKWWSKLFNLIWYHPKKNKEQFDISSTRHMSTGMDARGIDIWFNPETVPPCLLRIKDQRKEQQSNGKSTSIKLDGLLDMVTSKRDIPMLFTRITHKKNNRTYIDHEVVTMHVSDFEELIEAWYYMQKLKYMTPVYQNEQEIDEILSNY